MPLFSARQGSCPGNGVPLPVVQHIDVLIALDKGQVDRCQPLLQNYWVNQPCVHQCSNELEVLFAVCHELRNA